MKRREFITLIGGAAVAWPLAARAAQQTERIRRIGVLTSAAADDPGEEVRLAAFEQALHASGWTVGSNVRIDWEAPGSRIQDTACFRRPRRIT
jgi:putative ABC transport system substrate-binding protein